MKYYCVSHPGIWTSSMDNALLHLICIWTSSCNNAQCASSISQSQRSVTFISTLPKRLRNQNLVFWASLHTTKFDWRIRNARERSLALIANCNALLYHHLASCTTTDYISQQNMIGQRLSFVNHQTVKCQIIQRPHWNHDMSMLCVTLPLTKHSIFLYFLCRFHNHCQTPQPLPSPSSAGSWEDSKV